MWPLRGDNTTVKVQVDHILLRTGLWMSEIVCVHALLSQSCYAQTCHLNKVTVIHNNYQKAKFT